MSVVNLKEAAEISDEMTREELEMKLAVMWGDLAYEQDENRHIKELCAEMFREHQRLYSEQICFRSPATTSKQMAHWYGECIRWGIEVAE